MIYPTSNLSHLANAEMIGTECEFPSLTYCEDDNTYTEDTYTRRAWACKFHKADPRLIYCH